MVLIRLGSLIFGQTLSQVSACKDTGYDWFEQLLQNVSILCWFFVEVLLVGAQPFLSGFYGGGGGVFCLLGVRFVIYLEQGFTCVSIRRREIGS